MRKISESTQLIRLRYEMKLVVNERQTWATRAGAAERALEQARAEVLEWQARFDRLLWLDRGSSSNG